MSRNRLGDETSPYLLQHKDNPVHWQAWSPAALAAAKSENKPILLSIGYAACHWCHVMAHECFEDPAIAGVMNELFVNIKVDREERPDLDVMYQSALALLGQQGGWPLTMFLAPDGAPFWGGTYFPPESRYGRPGLPEVLRGIAGVYRSDPDKVTRNIAALREGLEKLSKPSLGGAIDGAAITQVAARLLQEVDSEHGGIGDAPKFPQCGLFALLWRAWKRTGDMGYRDAVTLTLARMCQGGIYDHLGGGFARYTVDRAWLVPHFEKMLYDNAQLIELLCLVWRETRDPLYKQRVEETVEWLMREMRSSPGRAGTRAFASSLDADSEGEEGKFYVWSEAELDEVLGADEREFKAIYGVTPGGNWEGENILNRLAGLAHGDDRQEQRLAAQRIKLLSRRQTRVRPGWDDKVLADWNGLAISSLVEAALAMDRPDWREAAEDAFAFIVAEMSQGDRLSHSWRAGRAAHPATLDDYANMARAALSLHEATGAPAYLAQAEAWLAKVEAHHGDGAGAYYFSADDTTDILLRSRTASDHAVPSGNGTLVGVFARLFYLTGDPAYRLRAEALVKAFSGELAKNFFPLATLLNNVDLLNAATQVVIVGPAGGPETQGLCRAVHGCSVPNLVLTVVEPGAALPAGHPAAGKTAIKTAAAAFVCHGPTCSLPIASPTGLARALARG